jgi:hypothetical protein
MPPQGFKSAVLVIKLPIPVSTLQHTFKIPTLICENASGTEFATEINKLRDKKALNTKKYVSSTDI